MKIIQALKTETREGFRLLMAWMAGVLSFGLLSRFSEGVLSYFGEGTSHSDTELALLLLLIGLGTCGIAVALMPEALKRRRP